MQTHSGCASRCRKACVALAGAAGLGFVFVSGAACVNAPPACSHARHQRPPPFSPRRLLSPLNHRSLVSFSSREVPCQLNDSGPEPWAVHLRGPLAAGSMEGIGKSCLRKSAFQNTVFFSYHSESSPPFPGRRKTIIICSPM